MWPGLLALAWLATGALLPGGCGVRQRFPAAQPGEGGTVRATVTRPGLNRILVKRPRQAPPWRSLVLRNSGPGALRAIKLWGLGRGADALVLKRKEEGEGFTPFSLLPDERLICQAGEGGGAGLLRGTFYWELPQAPARIQACLNRMRQGEIGENRITLTPAGEEAWLELRFDAPMPHTAARLAWQTTSATASPRVWINTEGDVWALLPQPRPKVDWLNPLDLTASLKGRRHFWVRLAYQTNPKNEGETGGEKTLEITRIRMEREVEGPGSLRPWRSGLNELSLSFNAAQPPRLDVELLNLQ